jgi:TetR/AcrR family tetracycline transcriptional repressor
MNVDRIVEAGMAVFAEVGYERLSMRLVASRLGVQAASLYYHVRNKGMLVALMADRVAQEGLDAGTAALAGLPADATPRDRAVAQLAALRVSLLRHQGSARLLSSSPGTLGPGALGLMERLLTTLADAGLPDDDAVVVADVLLSYVTGFVTQEQADPVGATLRRDPVVPVAEYPRTAALAGRFDDDAMFRRGVGRLALLVDP